MHEAAKHDLHVVIMMRLAAWETGERFPSLATLSPSQFTFYAFHFQNHSQ